MLKSNKLITSLMLSAILVIGSTFTVLASIIETSTTNGVPTTHNTIMPGTDLWTRGIHNYGNGWYMGYSYYKNDAYWHYVKVTISSGVINYRSQVAPYTVCANSPDSKSTSGFTAYCGIDTNR
ncbi:MAG: hypothetical protein H7Y18_03040 [Clostridiaceae bacterium]|nr:hypothetical protein [Clostridiaceae bacterium]